MEIGPEDITRMIDVSAVQAFHGEKEVRELAAQAIRHGFFAAHVLPSWIPLLRELLAGSATLVGAPIGFPGGGQTTSLKVTEARQLVAAGVQDLDLMMNVGRLLSGHQAYVIDEVRAVVEAVAPMPVKVIIEAGLLPSEALREACQICVQAGAALVKTGSGWASTGATLEKVTLISQCVGKKIGIKAAGGVRGLESFRALLRLGVRRFGVNATAALEIVEACRQAPGGRIII